MAINNDLLIKFSNTMYATKQDVMNQMKVPIIDNIWNEILKYRSNFQMILTLRHITGTNYNVCLTPAICERVSSVERKMMRAMVNYSRLNEGARNHFRDERYIEILRVVARKYNLDVKDDMLRNIVTNNASLIPPEMMILSYYIGALRHVENHYEQFPDDNFLGQVYSAILGNIDLTEFYRSTDEGIKYSKTLINKIYMGLPSDAIDSAMDNLFNFLKNTHASIFIKAACALYFMYYVRPFETHNEEISILLFKQILAHEDLEAVGAMFNFESLLANTDEFEKNFKESQQTFDLTYILNYILRKTEGFLDGFLDKLILEKKEEIALETYRVDTKPEISEEKVQEVEQTEENTSEIAYSSGDFNPVAYNKEVAITTLPAGLNEDEATKLETHLLELYPDMKRAQAYFYARHCTLGMKYTIHQFQRAVSCAYETARTSMDNLVYLGFYRKENIKNRYVYTPIKRK